MEFSAHTLTLFLSSSPKFLVYGNEGKSQRKVGEGNTPWKCRETFKKLIEKQKKTVRDIDQHSIEATKNKKNCELKLFFPSFYFAPHPDRRTVFPLRVFCSASCTARCVMIDLFFSSLQSISHFGAFCIIWISFLVNVSHQRATLGAAGGFYQWEGNFSFTSNPLSKGEPSYVSASMCVNA